MHQTLAATQHVFEAWKLTGNSLRLGSGSYGDRDAMRLESEEVRFSEGTGLPGKVWSTGAPVLFDEFRAVDFVRTEAARSVGLSAGIGLPIIEGNELTSVFTILAAQVPSSFVCEIWTPGENDSLKLRTGYYGQFRHFQGISSLIKFPYGQGLPGAVWASKLPQLIENVGTSPGFYRATDARHAGLFVGLGIPVTTPIGLEVVLLLSSKEHPLAKVIEIWKPVGDRLELSQRASANGLPEMPATCSVGLGEGLAGRVGQSCLPIVTEDIVLTDGFRAEALDRLGLSTGSGLPVMVDGQLTAVVVLVD